jgi:hypothetical protein
MLCMITEVFMTFCVWDGGHWRARHQAIEKRCWSTPMPARHPFYNPYGTWQPKLCSLWKGHGCSSQLSTMVGRCHRQDTLRYIDGHRSRKLPPDMSFGKLVNTREHCKIWCQREIPPCQRKYIKSTDHNPAPFQKLSFTVYIRAKQMCNFF